jgi:hypothetical protein
MDTREAYETLEMIKRAREQTQRAVARSGTAYYFLIWGAVWLFGFLGSQLLPGNLSGWLWMVLDIFGGVSSVWVALRMSHAIRSPHGKRVAALWLLLILYSVILIWIALPVSPEESLLLASVLASLGYVVMGLWFETRLLYIGLTITALAILGWQIMPEYLGYWLALIGGGGLISVGTYILKFWK